MSAWLSLLLLDRKNNHRRQVLAGFEEKRRLNDFDQGAIVKGQDEKLARLLAHAQKTVPYYRKVLDGQDDITADNAREILRRMPVLKRSSIQTAPMDFVSCNPGWTTNDATGGSTGTPMRFTIDRLTQVARESSIMWSDSLAGWIPGLKIAMLWGADRDVEQARRNIRLRFRWWMENRQWFNAFDMGPSEMGMYHKKLNAFRPHLLVAYAGAIYEFARFLKEKGWEPHYPSMAIVSSAEVLTPDMRKEVESVFPVKIYNRYGNREFAVIAAECEAHEGLHVNMSDMIVEIDSPNPTQVPGPIRITYLRNEAMPFIRYETGDLALNMQGSCSCGRTGDRLARIVGRQSDMIRTADGTVVHGEYFTHLFYHAPSIRQFQFIQEDWKHFRLLLAADPVVAKSCESTWRQEIAAAVGRDARLEIEYVDRIPVLASGKYRFTISKVRNDGREAIES